VHNIENNEDGEAPCAFTPVTVQASIGARSIRLLLDTGSGVSLIPVSTLQQLRSAGMGCIAHCIEKVQLLCTNNHGCWSCSNQASTFTMCAFALGRLGAIVYHVHLPCVPLLWGLFIMYSGQSGREEEEEEEDDEEEQHQ